MRVVFIKLQMYTSLSCVFVGIVLVFFFKQKTAYEMRISDWSSDVCSSDLSSTPGITPAMNSLPTEVSVAAAYTTITIDGGIRIPRVPALQTIPAPNDCG